METVFERKRLRGLHLIEQRLNRFNRELEKRNKIKELQWYKKNKKKYRSEVDRLSSIVIVSNPDVFKGRSFDTLHVDHKVSVCDGYKYGFPVSWIADITNLRLIPADLNTRVKGIRSVGNDLRAMIKRMKAIEGT